jgi:hypothetical protein
MRFWIVHLALLPVCLWALVELFSVSSAKAAMGIATWLVAAAIVHDFVVLPVYAALDRPARRALPGAAVNYVRVPAGLSLLMLCVFWGMVGRAGDGAYHAVSGRSFDGYAARWLLGTAALFAASGVIYLARRGSADRRRRGR